MKIIAVLFLFLLVFSCAHTDLRLPSEKQQERPRDKQPAETEEKEHPEGRAPSEDEEEKSGKEPGAGEFDREESGKEDSSADSKPGTGTILAKKKKGSELSFREIVSQAKEYGSPDYKLLYRNDRPYFIRKDLFSDEREDILAVYISNGEEEEEEEADFSRYSNISRLYEEKDTIFQCHILHFLVTEAGLVPENRYSFGKHQVLEDIRELHIRKNRPFPFAVIMRFQSVEGSEQKWLIFAENHVTRFYIKETFSNRSIVNDIDGDGTEDIIFFDKVFEEGSGYETFITWYRWNGRDFEEYKTINIVRNLREFLSRIKTLILEEECRLFAETALRPEDTERIEQGKDSYRELCSRIFVPVEKEVEEINPLLTEKKEIVDIIYPEILENPFLVEGVREEVFLLQMRIVTFEGSYLYQAKLAMPENPFSEQQFYFILQ